MLIKYNKFVSGMSNAALLLNDTPGIQHAFVRSSKLLQVDRAEEPLRAFHFAEDPLGRVRAPFARHPHVEDGRVGLDAPRQAGGTKQGALRQNVDNTYSRKYFVYIIDISRFEELRWPSTRSCTRKLYLHHHVDSLTWSS